jgi:hypothetical protein
VCNREKIREIREIRGRKKITWERNGQKLIRNNGGNRKKIRVIRVKSATYVKNP